MSEDARWDGEARAREAAGGAGDTLTVQVDGRRNAPTIVYVLTRSRDALVEVREFRPGCSPLEYTATGDELLALFTRAERERRRLSESVYAIRRWLE